MANLLTREFPPGTTEATFLDSLRVGNHLACLRILRALLNIWLHLGILLAFLFFSFTKRNGRANLLNSSFFDGDT